MANHNKPTEKGNLPQPLKRGKESTITEAWNDHAPSSNKKCRTKYVANKEKTNERRRGKAARAKDNGDRPPTDISTQYRRAFITFQGILDAMEINETNYDPDEDYEKRILPEEYTDDGQHEEKMPKAPVHDGRRSGSFPTIEAMIALYNNTLPVTKDDKEFLRFTLNLRTSINRLSRFARLSIDHEDWLKLPNKEKEMAHFFRWIFLKANPDFFF
ncbi:hypothetical protein FSHL1_007450 [Fusarium sambucinum]